MIIPNGHIEFITVSGGGLNPSTGFPVETTKSYSEPIPCQFIERNINMIAKDQKEPVIRQGYTVLLESASIEGTERLRLTDNTGYVIGEFPIISKIPLVAVNETKITI